MEKAPKSVDELKGFNNMMCCTNLLKLLILSAILSGCVSVSLPSAKSSKAKGVKWNAPASPFENLNDTAIDQAWMSKKTGNTISYLSECSSTADRSLESLQSEALNVLTKLQVQEEKNLDFNGRRALLVTARGEVDGVAVKMSLLTLKKNDCNYSLTYSGLEKTFDAETSFFQKFLDSFEAP
ncbi:MAG: hypothetical protein KF789_02130 [Bdellovibrionaceae bacterium]|nr:hypothetical protein [Pseudobdellovibrionaceae bacterium]